MAEVSTYAYEFTDRREALGFLVADTKLTQDNLDEVIVSFLFEISFFGYEQEHLEEEKKKLDESIKECEEHPERLVTFSHEDFCKKYGLPIEEEYPEESERKHNFYEAGMEYTKYCKKIELEKIKTFLINHNFNGSLIEFADEK